MTESSPLDNVRIVLVGPLYGGNVGSVCRVIRNMGLSRLVIAEPRRDLDLAELERMASHAFSVYENRREVPTLGEAVADCGLVAATSARLGLYRAHSMTPREAAPKLLAAAAQTPVALVFGPEDSGLTNEHLGLCTQIIQIPSSPSYLSLNLSHAVMVCCYELFTASGQFEPSEEKSPEAAAEARRRMFEMWEQALLEIGFMKSDKAEHMMLGLKRILSRGTLTENDVKILMGMARQTLWCGKQLRREKNDSD
jgi:tRNA/rRNA methyltransferase